MRKYWVFLGVVFLLAVAMVLYLLLRPGDDPGAEQELTEEMQTPRVQRADRAAPAPSDSAAQADADDEIEVLETAADDETEETDIQGVAPSAQSGEEKPALTPLQQERYDFLAKAAPIMLDLQLETRRHQFEFEASPWASDFTHPNYHKGKAEWAEARKKLREAQAAISQAFAPEVVFDSNRNLEYFKVEELVGGTLPPEYLDARDKYADNLAELLERTRQGRNRNTPPE